MRPVLQHGHVVAERQHLVEAMGDVEKSRAFLAEALQQALQRLRLMSGERGGGLVEDEHARLAIERLGDLHQLPSAQRKAPRREFPAVPTSRPSRRRSRTRARQLGIVDEAGPARDMRPGRCFRRSRGGLKGSAPAEPPRCRLAWPPRASDASTARPSISIAPPSGRSAPETMLIRVDLPAPFSPSKAWIRPGISSMETSRSTGLPKKAFDMPRAATTGAGRTIASLAFWRYCCARSLFEHGVVIVGIDVAVGRELSRPRQVVLLEVFVVDDRQRHLDEGRNVLALERLDGRVDRQRSEPVGLHGRPALQSLLLPELEELAGNSRRSSGRARGPADPWRGSRRRTARRRATGCRRSRDG